VLTAGLLFCRPAQGSDNSIPKLAGSSVLVSSLRLERITRLVQAYRPTSLPVFSCPELSSNFKLDDFSGESSETTIIAADDASLKLALRFAWDETGLYAALAGRGAPEAPLSGDIARLGLTEAGAGEAKTSHEYIVSVGENGLNLRPVEAGLAPALTTAPLPDGYQGETKFPWSSLAPATPFSEGLIFTVQMLSSQTLPTTPPKQYLLLLVPRDPGAPRGYLGLVGPAGGSGKVTGDGLVSQWYLSSPEPREIKLRLQIFRLAEGGEREVMRITQGVRLEQGVNSFRLYWDCRDASEGSYLLQATAAGDRELYSRRLPFSLTHSQLGGQ
jgi:hypothetical protein